MNFPDLMFRSFFGTYDTAATGSGQFFYSAF
jgi:hypothetical protein